MEIHAVKPVNKPEKSAVLPLDPVNLGGAKFYGWKILPTKDADSGHKDKQGREIVGSKIDESGTPVYDKITALLKAGKLNDPAVANLMMSNTQMTIKLAKLSQKVDELVKQNGGNK